MHALKGDNAATRPVTNLPQKQGGNIVELDADGHSLRWHARRAAADEILSLIAMLERAYPDGIERVWACVRRAIIGTWHGVEEKQLQRYIDDVCFRLNAGNVGAHLADRMNSMLMDMAGTPHMSYAELIAAGVALLVSATPVPKFEYDILWW